MTEKNFWFKTAKSHNSEMEKSLLGLDVNSVAMKTKTWISGKIIKNIHIQYCYIQKQDCALLDIMQCLVHLCKAGCSVDA